jgi:hypothetical protein
MFVHYRHIEATRAHTGKGLYEAFSWLDCGLDKARATRKQQMTAGWALYGWVEGCIKTGVAGLMPPIPGRRS